MYATYTLRKDELTTEFVENMKKLITTDKFQLSIQSYEETDYLKSSKLNHRKLLRSIKNVEFSEFL